jgi:hypothetical protein
MAQGFTRGTPIDTDPTLSLDSDLVVPSQKAIKDYVDTGLNTKQDTITLTTTGTSGAATLSGATLNIPQYGGGSVTSVSATVPSPTSPALSVNVSNPTTTPAIAITANGTTSQYFRGDGSLAAFPSVLLQSGRFAWLTQLFEHSQGLIYSIEYVAAYNKIFVGGTGNNVSIFDATTGELLSTVPITAVQRIRYISSTNEVWTTSSTTAVITRISPATNTQIGTITTSVVANGWEILEYSSTKVFITIGNGSGSILVINPGTLPTPNPIVTATITTGVPSFPSGMALNNNVASAQFDRIVVASNLGVAILNPNTNAITTTIVNPSSAFSGGRDIVYSPTDDKYYAASQVNHRIICLNIASATTFTLNKIKYSAYQVIGLQIDETNDLLMFTQLASGTGNLLGVFCNFIQKSTFDSYTNIVTNLAGGGSSIAGPIKLDATNKRVFVAGTQSAGRSVITVRYL